MAKNKCKNQTRDSHGREVNAKWFNERVKRNRKKQRAQKLARRKQRRK